MDDRTAYLLTGILKELRELRAEVGRVRELLEPDDAKKEKN